MSEEVPTAGGGGAAPVPAGGWWARLRRSPARAALGAAAGILAGVVYALAIGCKTGQCPLTSSPLNAGVFGAVVGAVLGWPERRRE